MDTKLGLLHSSLGLAFTAEFSQGVTGYPPCFVQGNAALDGLPDGCTGCRETLTGELQCCQEMDP